ncbi:MAG TPA: BON domain-containing protein [Candidatus Acidoferrales bacterium]|nr:BON domain-containing protein [Candidatus Acidoferrales bacterium]
MELRCGAAVTVGVGLFAAAALAGEPSFQLDPFGQATHDSAVCPVVKPPLLTEDEMRTEAHVRVERGTYYALEGTSEPGGAYRRDREFNAEVIAAISADPRFRNTSVWVTTCRGWVMLEGCVRSYGQRKALVAFVKKQPNAVQVFYSLTRLTK